MAEYIDREHLAKLLTEDIELFGEKNSSAKPIAYGTVMGLETALRYVNGVGAADVVEVMHGEWKDGREGDWRCSNCNEYFTIDIDMHPIDDCEMNYCPNCGAKMDGKDGAK